MHESKKIISKQVKDALMTVYFYRHHRLANVVVYCLSLASGGELVSGIFLKISATPSVFKAHADNCHKVNTCLILRTRQYNVAHDALACV